MLLRAVSYLSTVAIRNTFECCNVNENVKLTCGNDVIIDCEVSLKISMAFIALFFFSFPHVLVQGIEFDFKHS